MERLVKGDVVVVPFPFSNLADSKNRPAVVIATPQGNDVILCQVTTRAKIDEYSITLDDSDFKEGRLEQPSLAKPQRIVSLDKTIILYKVGRLKDSKTKELEDEVVKIIRAN